MIVSCTAPNREAGSEPESISIIFSNLLKYALSKTVGWRPRCSSQNTETGWFADRKEDRVPRFSRNTRAACRLKSRCATLSPRTHNEPHFWPPHRPHLRHSDLHRLELVRHFCDHHVVTR